MLTSKSEGNLFNKCSHKCKPVLDLEVKIFWSCANDYKSVMFDLQFRSYLVPFKDTPLCPTPFLLPLLKVVPWPFGLCINFGSWFCSAPRSPFSSEPVAASVCVSCTWRTDFFFAVYVFPPKQVTVRHGGCSRNLHPSLLLVSPFPCKPQSTPLSFVAFVTAEEETDFAVLPSTSEPSPKNGTYNIENLPT